MARSRLPFTLCLLGSCHKERAFLDRQPVAKPHAEFLCSLHATNTSSEVGTEQSGICRLVGQSSNRGKPHVDRAGRQQFLFKMNPLARRHCLVE